MEARTSSTAAAAAPLPPDDLLLEILLRLPPEPIHLFRASFVCKHWRGLVHDARFLRRFRDFHGGTPPVLGFFNQAGPPLFVPTSGGFALSTATVFPDDWWALDCRHGRVLLDSCRNRTLLVWEPMTGDKRYLPPPAQASHGSFEYNAAVLCAAGHTDHGDCHSCPFLVAFVFSHQTDFITSACVFSSETGVWGEITSILVPYALGQATPTALVGNTIYWLLDNCSIFEFDLDKHMLGLTEEFPYDALESYERQIVIMPTDVGWLGLAGVEEFNLHLWSKVVSVDGVVTWTHQRVIDLKKFLPPEVVAGCMVQDIRAEAVGYAEDADVIFIDVYPSIYMIHLKSMKVKEVSGKLICKYILPYSSFYAPGIAIDGGKDQA
ncbi:hypothetical protein CFC21_054285 [Triticum aestivum]|uniref:F-box domain-containing protein n=2 Tax=Triticum aestivum TaxID=4565 RepID=A0A3B6HZ03_WHEAT|nr:uncharacterized protein LOC123082729 [Triticum aestivum]KAF7045150.1 hypothetical protein CFC21_054285 [Triticum aestivum]